jgi:outer membrane protein OmpA-like peptidoglycan-associated protein
MHPIPVLSIACLLVAACAPAQTKTETPASTNQAPTRTMTPSELMKTLNERGVAAIDIQFEDATATLTPASGASLKVIAATLRSDATLKLNIQDHTAAAGSRAANQALSNARAAAIRDTLIRAFAIAPDRLTATGLGDTDPSPGTRAGERPRTERVEIVKLANKTGGAQNTSTTRGAAEWTGRVQTGMMAVGGETTGIVLTVGSERFELQAGDESMRRQLGDLNGKTATIRGTLEVRPGVEVRSRRIITVSEIVPNR